MATASVTYTFAPLTLAESVEVNTNFQDLVTFLNGSVMHRDASGAFTAVPSGPSLDPSADNHLARKRYVDRRVQRGSLSMNFTAEVFKSATITFTFPFAANPTVCITGRSTANTAFAVRSNVLTTTTIDFVIAAYDSIAFTGTVFADWIAVGTPV